MTGTCTVRVNLDRYVELLDDMLVSKLRNIHSYESRIWFQQDGTHLIMCNASVGPVCESFPVN